MNRHVPTGEHFPGDLYPGAHDHRTEHALHGHGGVSPEADFSWVMGYVGDMTITGPKRVCDALVQMLKEEMDGISAL